MTHPIPIFAWVVIGLFALLVIGLNLSLWSAYRNRNKKPSQPRTQKTKNTLQDPWFVEDQQWKELSDHVEKFKKSRS